MLIPLAIRSARRHYLTVPCYRRSTFGRRAFTVGGRRPGTAGRRWLTANVNPLSARVLECQKL